MGCRTTCGAGCAESDDFHLRGVGTVTEVGMTTRVAVAAIATAAASVVGAAGVVLAVDDRRRAASSIPNPSASFAPSAAQSTPAPTPNSDCPTASSAAAPEYEESGCERSAGLDLEADPLGRLVETNETDNATSVALQVDGTRVRKVNSAACR
jgi:hypothetical protein